MMKHMKLLKRIAVLLSVLLVLSACGGKKQPTQTPDPTPTAPATETPSASPEATPAQGSGIPEATTTKKPTKEGETYQSTGIYLGMADNNLLVVIEANTDDGRPEQSYKTSSDLDLTALGVTEGTPVDITYTVDSDGMKHVKTIVPKKQ